MDKDIKTKVRDFLSDRFKNYEFKDEEDIFASGFVNSLFAMQLVMFVEEAFEMTIEDEEMDLDNFRSINALTNLINNKKNSS